MDLRYYNKPFANQYSQCSGATDKSVFIIIDFKKITRIYMVTIFAFPRFKLKANKKKWEKIPVNEGG